MHGHHCVAMVCFLSSSSRSTEQSSHTHGNEPQKARSVHERNPHDTSQVSTKSHEQCQCWKHCETQSSTKKQWACSSLDADLMPINLVLTNSSNTHDVVLIQKHMSQTMKLFHFHAPLNHETFPLPRSMKLFLNIRVIYIIRIWYQLKDQIDNRANKNQKNMGTSQPPWSDTKGAALAWISIHPWLCVQWMNLGPV
jgi:hypothetical protein